MTDLILVTALGFMAVLLGAASLAIFLLYRGWRSNRALITELKAQLAAQQIAALTGDPGQPGGVDALPPEPARRRRHLSLYLGGGVVALLTSCRDGLRSLIRTRPAIAAATVATVGATAALVLVPGGPDGPDGSVPPTASSDTTDLQAAPPSPGESGGPGPDDVAPRGTGSLAAGPPLLSPAEHDDDTPDGQTPAGDAPPQSESAPQAEPGAADAVQPPTAAPPYTGAQPGDEPAAEEAPEPPAAPGTDSRGLCLEAPPLVDACLLTG